MQCRKKSSSTAVETRLHRKRGQGAEYAPRPATKQITANKGKIESPLQNSRIRARPHLPIITLVYLCFGFNMPSTTFLSPALHLHDTQPPQALIATHSPRANMQFLAQEQKRGHQTAATLEKTSSSRSFTAGWLHLSQSPPGWRPARRPCWLVEKTHLPMITLATMTAT